MSRSHVEFVTNEELDWREEQLSSQFPPVRNKPLSVDDETGAFTRIVALPEGWEAGSVTVPTTQELYVLEGHLTVDGHDIPAESYLRVPADVPVDSVAVTDDARVLWTSDSALDGPGDHDGHRFWQAPESEFTHVDPEEQTGAASFLARAESGRSRARNTTTASRRATPSPGEYSSASAGR